MDEVEFEDKLSPYSVQIEQIKRIDFAPRFTSHDESIQSRYRGFIDGIGTLHGVVELRKLLQIENRSLS